MTLVAAALLALTLQVPSTPTVGAQPPGVTVSPKPGQTAATADSVPLPTDSYADSAASELMARTRTYADATKSGIEAYRMLSRYSLSAGLSTGRRDRLLYKRESAWRVSWRRDEEWRIEVVGSREVLPLLRNAATVGDLDDEISSLDPEFIIGNRGQSVFRIPSTPTDRSGFQHPLANGSEEHYRFASGDTTRIQIPGSGGVTLVELKVIPRRASARLLNGSYWFDAASGAPVRAAFRLASPVRIDLDADGARLLPGLSDASFELDHLTLEYALWEGRWWLPRVISVQGRGRFAGVDLPVLLEQTFEEIEIFSNGDDWSPLPPPDTSVVREIVDDQEDSDQEDEDDEENEDDVDDGSETDADTEGDLPRRVFVMRSDSALIESSFLPEPASAIQSSLSDLDIERIRASLTSTATVLSGAQLEVGWSPIDPGLLRYNRVEGFSLGSSLTARYGPLSAHAAVRIGLAGPTPSAELGVRQAMVSGDREVRLYSEVTAFTPGDRPLAFGNSASTLLLGRDEGDYFRASGIEATLRRRFSRWSWSEAALTLFAEHQGSLARNTGWSLRPGTDLRPNPAADPASQVGMEALLETRTGVQANRYRAGVAARLRGEAGDFVFARGSVDGYVAFPLPGPLVGGIEGGAGQILGTAPVQSIWYVGGSSTVRGFDPEDRTSGETFWRSRGEIATERPGVRGILFVDAGRAASQFTMDGPQLISAGVGVSALDGMVRADLARALRGGSGWGLQLYLDAPL